MATKPVKWFRNGMTGAPVLNGVVGSLIAVLDACLINGFNLVTLDSLAVAGNVLTGTKAGHGFEIDQVIVTSANEAALIGEWTVTAVTSSTFTAAAAGVANVAGTGTLTAKAAPLGWQKVFTGTNKAVYRSTDVTGSRMYLRVDDTAAQVSRVRGYEAMTDIDTGTGPFPTDIQISGGGYWGKSDAANATANNWALFGNSNVFFSQRRYGTSQASGTDTSVALDMFGDFPSLKPGDAYNCLLSCTSSQAQAIAPGYSALSLLSGTATVNLLYGARSHTQIGTAISNLALSSNGMGLTVIGISSGAPSLTAAYPSPLTNGLFMQKPCMAEGNNVRCLEMPGLFHIVQSLTSFGHLVKMTAIPGFADRTFVSCHAPNQGAAGASVGIVAFDITGPW